MPDQSTHHRGHGFGYFFSILINAAILYVINTFEIWDYVPFLTEDFLQVLWATNLSIGVTIFMYCTFLVFDRKWFRNLMQAMANVFSMISMNVFRQVMPLDLSESTARWVNIGILILMGIMVLSTISELASAIKNYRKSIPV